MEKPPSIFSVENFANLAERILASDDPGQYVPQWLGHCYHWGCGNHRQLPKEQRAPIRQAHRKLVEHGQADRRELHRIYVRMKKYQSGLTRK